MVFFNVSLCGGATPVTKRYSYLGKDPPRVTALSDSQWGFGSPHPFSAESTLSSDVKGEFVFLIQ